MSVAGLPRLHQKKGIKGKGGQRREEIPFYLHSAARYQKPEGKKTGILTSGLFF